MKTVGMILIMFVCLSKADPLALPCPDLARKTEETFLKMDRALKIKTGMLLGEMESAKGALEGCITQNKQVSTNIALIWILTDLGLGLILGFILFHQARMKRAIRVLSGILNSRDPTHSVRYVPSQSLYHWALGLLGLTFIVLNTIALLL
jgi:hypothetical protein